MKWWQVILVFLGTPLAAVGIICLAFFLPPQPTTGPDHPGAPADPPGTSHGPKEPA